MYWAEALARQTNNSNLSEIFTKVAQQLKDSEAIINEELIAAQGHSIEIAGYYKPDVALVSTAMRPSETLNSIISNIG